MGGTACLGPVWVGPVQGGVRERDGYPNQVTISSPLARSGLGMGERMEGSLG